MNMRTVKAKVEALLKGLARASSQAAYSSVIPKSCTNDKPYKAHVLSLGIEKLSTQEDYGGGAGNDLEFLDGSILNPKDDEPMSKKKPNPGGRPKKKAEVSLVRSSAAEYLSFVAADDSELEEASVVKHYLVTAADSKKYQMKHYSLQAIIAHEERKAV